MENKTKQGGRESNKFKVTISLREFMKINKKKIAIYGLAFAIPIIILLIDYYMIGIFPFGDKTILYRDSKGQYVSYFSDFREAIMGNGSLLYSFTKGLGGNMIGILTYYLISPFNIIILLFPARWIAESILVITILKIGTCGVTFTYFMRKVYKAKDYKILLFSTAYALMGFNIIYQSNVMWLDAVYMLPLIALGIHRIVELGKKKVYIATLALTIMTGFYTGFMICIFCVIYFGYVLLKKYFKENKDCKFIKNRILNFIVGSIIAGVLSAITLIPTIFALQGGKSRFAFFTDPITTNFKVFDLFQRIFINSVTDVDILRGKTPNLYIGVILIIFVILYFLNKKIEKKDKLLTLGVLCIFFLSTYINKIDFIWHGFNKPIGFPFRYVFVIGFFLIIISYESFKEIHELSRNKVIMVTLGLLGLIGIYKIQDVGAIPNNLIIINIIFIGLYGAFIVNYIKNKNSKKIIITVAMLFMIELGINGYNTFKNLNYGKRNQLESSLGRTKKVMDYIENKYPGFYRMEKNFYYNINDSMLIDYKGIGHFSSMYRTALRETIAKMGLVDSGYWISFGSGGLLTSNSLLNVKYIVSKSEKPNPGYKFIEEYKGLYIYENMYYLEPGFMINKEVKDLKDTEDVFESQNELLNEMTGIEKTKYYHKIDDYEISKENLEKITDDNGNDVYEKIDPKEEAHLKITFKAPNNYPIYMMAKNSATIKVNGEYVDAYSVYNEKTVSIGQFKKGEKVNIDIKLNKKNITIKNNFLNYLNLDNYKKAYNELKKNELEITKVADRKIEGQINVTKKDSILYTTIPYEDGWTLKVNGVKQEIEVFNDALISIPLNEGENTIELEYMPKGIVLGTSITLVVSGFCIIYVFVRKRKAKEQK